ncbi:MAG: ParA family protein [Lachnospiraceae bacterium]|nr:ParA family protein [Lachnospiraceae bacterium]
MSRVIAVANQKGGVGKTTTTINLSASLAEAGKRVLVVDMDPQGNTSSGLAVNKYRTENGIYEVLIGFCPIEEALIRDQLPNLDILPANVSLSGAEVELISMDDNSFRLKKALDTVRDRYDFVLIDCPPSLSLLTVNSLTAADSVLVPIQCEYYALEGLSQLMHTIELIRERLNDRLEIEGIVFTMYDSRTKLSEQVVENVRANVDQKIYETLIPRNVRLAEAPSYGLPINIYDSRSTGAQSYRALAQEVIKSR